MGRLAPGMFGSNYFYRCGPCQLNLPHEDEFRKCPRCQVPTASRSLSNKVEILSREEINRLKFDWYLEDETDEQRGNRQVAAEVDARVRAERSSKFDDVIAAAGFQDWERERIAELEAKLRKP